MNNACPTCGAIYNVAAKDIGRRIKCKKCGAGLTVSDAGLELDAADAGEPDAGGDDVVTRPRARARKSGGGLGIDPVQIFNDFGGLAAVAFGFGAFLVIVFLFMPIIGASATKRAQGAVDRLEQEWKSKERKMRKVDKKTDDEISKAKEDFFKSKEELEDGVAESSISNRRWEYLERYGMMFGFIALMFGSLGFMMPGQSSTRRVVGAVVITSEMVLVFIYFLIRGPAA